MAHEEPGREGSAGKIQRADELPRRMQDNAKSDGKMLRVQKILERCTGLQKITNNGKGVKKMTDDKKNTNKFMKERKRSYRKAKGLGFRNGGAKQ